VNLAYATLACIVIRYFVALAIIQFAFYFQNHTRIFGLLEK